MLDLRISGSTEYFIELNGVASKYSDSNTSIQLKSGLNRIRVYTDQSCQGLFEEEIFISQELRYFPNPVKDVLNLYIGGDDHSAELSIRGINGEILLKRSIDIPAKRVFTINMSQYPRGTYFLTIRNSVTRKTIKVIKR
jgi:hypothetical protein